MKKNLGLILFAFLPLFAISQIQQAFNYQAVVRGSDGKILYNENADFFIELLQNGTTIYSEEHSDSTGKIGVVNFKIGKGNNPSSDFSQINWSEGQFQIRVTINGEPNPIGTADLVAVPFALYAQSSGNDNDWIFASDTELYVDQVSVGIGISTPQADLHIIDSDISLSGGGGILVGDLDGDNLAIDQNEIMARNNGAISRLSLQNEGGEIRVHGSEGQSTQFVIKDDGKVGIGINTPEQSLHIRKSNGDAQIRLERTGNNPGYSTIGGNGDGFVVGHFDINSGGYKRDMIVNHSGRATVNVLEIKGGGDGAEYFNVKKSGKLEKGSLVVIDEENEGKLKISSKAYDQRIAGIMSGAGGVQPGITLEQREILEGDELVSLWGRVYVKATAENGRIKPGDFLTSSNIKGHVMKATKKKKSRGAIIGRALSSLEIGEGLVLILIQPQ